MKIEEILKPKYENKTFIDNNGIEWVYKNHTLCYKDTDISILNDIFLDEIVKLDFKLKTVYKFTKSEALLYNSFKCCCDCSKCNDCLLDYGKDKSCDNVRLYFDTKFGINIVNDDIKYEVIE